MGMAPAKFDQIMSLHRRAYEFLAEHDEDVNKAFWSWRRFLERYCAQPESDIVMADVIHVFFDTACAARSAGMSKELAFPLISDIRSSGKDE